MTEAAIALGLLGAILGSFIAALVVRWPEGRSIATGRSACDGCGVTLRAHELVPIVSACIQRGRCRRCGAAIDPVHWRIEGLGLAIGLSAGWVAGWPGMAGAVFGWLLLALGALDLRAFWLPDRLTGPLAVLGLVAGLPALADRIIGGVAGFGALWAIAFAYRHVRGREGLGGGDPKLLGAIGLWLGWRMLPPVLLAASLLGLAVVLVRMLRGHTVRASDAVPLGVLLAAAAYPAWLLMVEGGP